MAPTKALVAAMLLAGSASGNTLRTRNLQKKTGSFTPPSLGHVESTDTSISIDVKASATGANAGFSLQWMLADEYSRGGLTQVIPCNLDEALTEVEVLQVCHEYIPKTFYPSDHEDLCKASFSGVPGKNPVTNIFNLAPYGNVPVSIGQTLTDVGASTTCAEILQCGKEYVFRTFAHNDPVSGVGKSGFSAVETFSTRSCANNAGCTLTQGFWGAHGPVPKGGNANEWPITSMTLGSVTYTDLQLLAVLDMSVGGNGLIQVAHQLIAAKLNIANGASPTDKVKDTITATDAKIGTLSLIPSDKQVVVACTDKKNQPACPNPPATELVVGFVDKLAPAEVEAWNKILTAFNEGGDITLGPKHCDDKEPATKKVLFL